MNKRKSADLVTSHGTVIQIGRRPGFYPVRLEVRLLSVPLFGVKLKGAVGLLHRTGVGSNPRRPTEMQAASPL